MMKNLFRSITVAALAAVLVAGAASADESGPAVKTAKVGMEAPGFTLTSATGEQVSLADYRGKHVVLEWVNFDCPFVKAHYGSGNIPGLQRTYTADTNAVWLTICSSAPGKQGFFEGETLRGRIEQEKWAGTAYLIDEKGVVGKQYEAKTTPHMYVITPDGVLAYAGAIDSQPTTDQAVIAKSTNYVAAALTASMSGKEIATKSSAPYGCGVKY